MQPEEIALRSFEGSLHGFDKSEVRQFLEEIAAEYSTVLSRVDSAEDRLDSLSSQLESVDELLRSANERCKIAEARVAELESGHDGLVATQEESPHDAARQVGDEVTAVLQAAVAAAQSIRTEAEEWAATMRRDVNKEISERISEARFETSEMIKREQDRLERLRTGETELRGWLRNARVSIEELLGDAAQSSLDAVPEFPLSNLERWIDDGATEVNGETYPVPESVPFDHQEVFEQPSF